jgi:hypothetical protein
MHKAHSQQMSTVRPRARLTKSVHSFTELNIGIACKLELELDSLPTVTWSCTAEADFNVLTVLYGDNEQGNVQRVSNLYVDHRQRVSIKLTVASLLG